MTFVNDSPQLEGNSITAEFTVSRSARLIECSIRSQGQIQERVNCEYNIVEFATWLVHRGRNA